MPHGPLFHAAYRVLSDNAIAIPDAAASRNDQCEYVILTRPRTGAPDDLPDAPGGLIVVVVAVSAKNDVDLRGADAESALESGYMKDGVESTSCGAVQSYGNALENNLAFTRLKWKSDSGGKGKIEKGQAAK